MTDQKDYADAPYYAITGLGYGKGFTVTEAYENYVQSQLRNLRAKDTIYETKPKFEAALRNGDLRPDIWKAPEGTTGFVLDTRLRWCDADNNYTEATEDQLVEKGGPRDA